MITELVNKKCEEDGNVGHIYLTFFSKDKIDVTTHLLYDMKDVTQHDAYHKAFAFFKVGEKYSAKFAEIPETKPTAPATETKTEATK